MEIRPGKGVSQVHFGLTEQELIGELGPPDKRYQTDSGALCLQYFDLRLEFSIEPAHGFRLGWVEVHNPEAMLCGHRLVGQPAAAVIPLVTRALGEEPEHEDYGSLETYF